MGKGIPLKIACVVSAIEVGGVETYLRTLAQRLADKGHGIVFVETHHTGRWSAAFEHAGFSVVQLIRRWHESAYGYGTRVALGLSDCDIVFLNDAPRVNPALGLLPPTTLVIPVLHLDLPEMIDNGLAAFEQCSHLVLISPVLEKSIAKRSIIAQDKVSLICNGVEVPAQYPRKNREQGAGGPLHIAFLGRVEHGHKGVLNIAPIVKQYMGSQDSLTLSIIGDGPDMDRLRASLAADCPWLPVNYHGYLDNEAARAVLATCDVLLMPSYYEGLPIGLLEAMALGVVPVVSRIAGSTDRVVTDGENGMIAGPDDLAAFGRALTRLAAEPDLRAKLSRNGWATVAHDFNAEKMAEHYLELMERLRASARDCDGHPSRSGGINPALVGEFAHWPLVLGLLFRKLRTCYRLLKFRRES